MKAEVDKCDPSVRKDDVEGKEIKTSSSQMYKMKEKKQRKCLTRSMNQLLGQRNHQRRGHLNREEVSKQRQIMGTSSTADADMTLLKP